MARLTHRTAPGCTYFVTTDTWQNREIFRVVELAELLCQRIVECRDQSAFLLHEFVVMPNHLHLLITPGATTTLERALQLIKGGASNTIHRQRGHKMQIWQPGFHESTIQNSKDYKTKCAYTRMNPVKAGLVEKPQDWPFGSASAKLGMDEIPQGLKPRHGEPVENVGAEAPTP